jgi:hypothetical protein
VLWPAAVWLALRSDPVETTWQILLAVSVGLLSIAGIAWMRRPVGPRASVDEPEPVVVA